MARGKYLSLEEARKQGLLEQFAKEHPNETDAERFNRLLEAMANKKGGEPKPASKSGSQREQK